MDCDEILVISRNPEVQARYEEMRRNGESHAMAEMLATRSFPGLRTDSEFNKGRCNGNQFEETPWLGDYYRARAEEAGVSVTGKYYQSTLARFPGDPEAWVGGRGDVEKICLQRGWGCEGSVQVDVGERPPIPDVPLAEDLIQREVAASLKENPYQRIEDVRERVLSTHTRSQTPDVLEDDASLTDLEFPEE